MVKLLNSNILKVIAIICMIIDHIGYFFLLDINYDLYIIFRGIGRIAMPIFVFLLVEGYIHTKKLENYIARVAIIAILTQIIITVFDIQIYGYVRGINILVSFVLILALLRIIDEKKICNNKNIDLLLRVMSLFSIVVIYFVVDIDYSYFAPILALFFYVTNRIKNKKNILIIESLYFLIIPIISIFAINNILGITTIISAFLIMLYNGKLGRKNKIIQYAYYLFFPVHYLIIYMIKLLLII